MNDYQLLKLRNTQYASIVGDSEAARSLANEYGLSYDSVRGRLSRANTPQNHAKLMKDLAENTPSIAPSVIRQIDITLEGHRRWKELKDNIAGNQTAVFLSDLHLPYTRWDAYELAMTIIGDLHPTVVSGANDLRDNTGLGRWGDNRPVRGQVMSSDDANIRRNELIHYRELNRKCGVVVNLLGNHDIWFYNNLRTNSPQTAELQIADYMSAIANEGVIQFSRGYEENYLELGHGLVWWHGQFTNKSNLALAKNNLEHFAHVFNDGRMRSVVAGHTHRPMVVEGTAVGYPSVKFVNSGALTDYAPYMKRNPHAWGLGITVCQFYFTSWEHEIDLLVFQEKGNKLVCRYNGTSYEVELNKEHKQDYN